MRTNMKLFAGILYKTPFLLGQKKCFKILAEFFFSIAAIALGIGFGCSWHLDTLTRFSDAFISQLLLTELVF